MNPSGRDRLPSIQVMRALAALMVVAFHSGREMAADGRAGGALFATLGILDFGVDLFFVISGFIIAYISSEAPANPATARRFILKRIIRVVPTYWIFTTLFLIPLLFAPGLLHRTGINLPYVIASYLFVPWPRPGDAATAITPVYGLGWALNYEMAFYGAYALLLALGVKQRIGWIVAGAAVLAALGTLVPPDMPQFFVWTRTLVLEFAAGTLLAAAYRGGRFVGPLAGAGIALSGLTIWIVSGSLFDVHSPGGNLRGLLWGAGAAAVIGAVVLAPVVGKALSGLGGKAMQFLGNASYSLYLTHLFAIRIVSILLDRSGIAVPNPVRLLIDLLLSVVVSAGVYLVIETSITSVLTNAAFRKAQIR